MNIEVVDAAALPARAARRIATSLGDAVAQRGSATLAVSGGSTPAAMLSALADEAVPWPRIHVFQVDERIAPDGDPNRNLGALAANLLDRLPRVGDPDGPAGVHPMPAAAALPGHATALAAADRYAAELAEVAGDPPTLDVVHLGVGDDGHTASLVPGDSILDVTDRAVAVSGDYRGHRRLTLTFPVLSRARDVVWLIAGADKAVALRRLVARDATIPAGRVAPRRAVVIADRAAAAHLDDMAHLDEDVRVPRSDPHDQD